MENVPALNSPRHKKNFEEWQSQLEEWGYINKQYLLNAQDFGLPQNRERLLMLSIYTDHDDGQEEVVKRYFDNKANSINPKKYIERTNKVDIKLNHFLKTDYSIEKYYQEALECQPNDTVSRRKIWDNNPKLTDEQGNVRDTITSTLTTKQDRHPNSGNLKVNFNNGKAPFRYLTPRECFLLMGFKEEDYEKVINGNFVTKANATMFTRDNLIKMAGNSIAVNVLEAVFIQVLELHSELYF